MYKLQASAAGNIPGFNRAGILLLGLLVYAAFSSCHSSNAPAAQEAPLFHLLSPIETGIDFTNRVVDSKEMNIFNYHNFYNGGGVAAGDINNDGRPDLFFVSNQGQCKLYLNKGNWKFDDISSKAGLQSRHQWHTGATMADINGDGWLDIYVCNSGIMPGDDRANELFINQHDGTFKEEAHQYGLDDKGESTQAVFFDYDRDGDLDCFVLNNSHRSIESFGYDSKLRNIRDPQNGDRLYRNDGGRFTDVSAQAGIYGSEIGFGLGITVGDINNDGWDDMYISNDFFERDYLYINQHNGTFKEVINEAIGHISNGSMGSDMADINNDGWLDVFTSEMLPESDYRLKTTVKFDDYDVQNAKNQLDFHHQFTSNCLQLNNHDGTFSEIAQLAGVDATGWSWGALSFDFDNDGWKDIFVCNGLNKDLTDQDFLEYFNNRDVMNQVMHGDFNFNDLLQK
ncbi:MAG TPA: VCBS repeat-containing protein, partial [Chitinophagaceae bacterium]|nr:VCBS repeat-containing protein [Chitinophagaceae bacterium]